MSTSLLFLRFLVVGALNTLFGYAVFVGLIVAGISSTPALVLTYVVGISFNFFTTRRYVFDRPGGAHAMARFVAAYVVIYFFNLGLFTLIRETGAGPLLVQAMCLPVVAVFSFLLFKLHVFRNPQ